MRNTLILKRALQQLDLEEPNVLFIGGDVTKEYLMFHEGDKLEGNEHVYLEAIGVTYVAKYAGYGIEREFLWDSRDK